MTALPSAQLNAAIADAIGLHFPEDRQADLQRGLDGAATELGFSDAAACAAWLLSAVPTAAQLRVLASHLTIGETYFFRDEKTFEAMAHRILPDVIRSRRGRDQRLRLWSAGCCTGEEAYSLSILLQQVLPDLADWRVSILATDINPHFLRKAAAGSYGEWSFRGAPAGFREQYFLKDGDGRYAIRPEIKKRVTFAPLNLAEDVLALPAEDTQAMDVIFCRNVLMYFAPAQARKTIANFSRLLVEGGCLVVSPSEASQALFPQFITRNFPGVIVYKKSEAKIRAGVAVAPPFFAAAEPAPAWEMPLPMPVAVKAPPKPAKDRPLFRPVAAEAETKTRAASLYAEGRYAEAADILLDATPDSALGPAECELLARVRANQGRLAEAQTWCARWLAADKMNSAGHYLSAVVRLEQGDSAAAQQSLQRAVYLDPDFVLAHFALGNLARGRGQPQAAERHFTHAWQVLDRCPPDEPLPESDGLTAARLREMIGAMMARPTP